MRVSSSVLRVSELCTHRVSGRSTHKSNLRRRCHFLALHQCRCPAVVPGWLQCRPRYLGPSPNLWCVFDCGGGDSMPEVDYNMSLVEDEMTDDAYLVTYSRVSRTQVESRL